MRYWISCWNVSYCLPILQQFTSFRCLLVSHYCNPLTAFMCMYQHIAIDISKAACVYTLLCSWRAGHSCLGQNPKLEFHKVHYLKLEPCKTTPGLLWMNVCVPVIFKLLSAELPLLFCFLLSCLISGFRCGENEICALRGCYPAYNGSLLPTFRNKLSVPSSTVKQSLTACQKSADLLRPC